jgi:hypothetical protein
MMLGNILQPQTSGFDHINMDMSVSVLDGYRQHEVQNCNDIINYAIMNGFNRVAYMERGRLATLLVSSRSLNGKSMDLFTKTVSEQKQEFTDKTEKKGGFPNFFNRGKKEEGA